MRISRLNSSEKRSELFVHFVFKMRNGNISTAPINLKTTSSVKPTIRKGSSINQTRGNRKSNTRASGQHTTKRRHHSTRARKVRMNQCLRYPVANTRPKPKTWKLVNSKRSSGKFLQMCTGNCSRMYRFLFPVDDGEVITVGACHEYGAINNFTGLNYFIPDCISIKCLDVDPVSLTCPDCITDSDYRAHR